MVSITCNYVVQGACKSFGWKGCHCLLRCGACYYEKYVPFAVVWFPQKRGKKVNFFNFSLLLHNWVTLNCGIGFFFSGFFLNSGDRSLHEVFKLFDLIHVLTTDHATVTRITQEVWQISLWFMNFFFFWGWLHLLPFDKPLFFFSLKHLQNRWLKILLPRILYI